MSYAIYSYVQCTKDYLGGEQWLEQVKGCVYCERMFTVGEK